MAAGRGSVGARAELLGRALIFVDEPRAANISAEQHRPHNERTRATETRRVGLRSCTSPHPAARKVTLEHRSRGYSHLVGPALW